jgi:DNA-binding response OmpR family regulator
MARQKTVLLVTKPGLVRNVTSAGLTMYGYDVLTAEYAEAAKSVRATRHIDVVVIDADLADKDHGISLARIAREAIPKIDVVYTSRMPNRVAAALQEAGAPVLRDPYHPHKLADVIAHLRSRPTEAPDASAA